MAKPKFDFKQFFLDKGEKVAIIVGGVLMILMFVLAGMAVATSASTDENAGKLTGGANAIYAVYAPVHPGHRYDVYRKMSLAEFATLPLQPEPGGIDCWSLLVWISKGSRPAATMEFIACPAPDKTPGWTIGGSQVRRRFEGTGIDDLLRAQAATLLAGRKMTLLEAAPA